MALDADLSTLANGDNFAALTTISADGHPRTHIMWVDADGDHLRLNTEVHRAKFRDIERDPRVTVTVWNAANPYQYVEARGHVAETVTGPEARNHIDELSRMYTGADYANPIQTERVLIKVAVDRIHKNGL